MVVRDLLMRAFGLQKFAKMSGLKVISDTTQIVWIGSKKKSKVPFLRDMNFCWGLGIFLVLGIELSTDTEHINVIVRRVTQISFTNSSILDHIHGPC